jgi:hypothetical protein
MWADGLVEEVRALRSVGLEDGLTASRALGYLQVLAFLRGETTEDEAREATVVATRKLARRQDKTFRKDPRTVVRDDTAPYYGAVIEERTLLPLDGAQLAETRLEEWLPLRSRYTRLDATPFDRERERSLRVLARPHAARADDAQIVVEPEIGIACIAWRGRPHLARRASRREWRLDDAVRARECFELAAAAVRATAHRMFGDVELENATT